MEQALVDKLKNGTLDDIDEDMIIARISNVDKRIEAVLKHISANIHILSDICDEYKEEVSLLGFTFVCAYDNNVQQVQRKKHGIYEENDAACTYVIGATDSINAMCKAIDRTCDKGQRG